MVGGEHGGRPDSRPQAGEPGVASHAGIGLASRATEPEGHGLASDPVLGSERGDACGHATALGVDAVVHVGHDELEAMDVG